MGVWRRVLRALGIVGPEVNIYPVEVELARTIQFLAEEEQRSEAAVRAEMVERALSRHAMVVEWRERWENLSRREKQAAMMVRDGYSTAEMAAEMGVKVNTIKAHVKGALRKFEVHSRGELRAILEELEEEGRR